MPKRKSTGLDANLGKMIKKFLFANLRNLVLRKKTLDAENDAGNGFKLHFIKGENLNDINTIFDIESPVQFLVNMTFT